MRTLTIEDVQDLSQGELNNLLIDLCEDGGSIEDIIFITTDSNINNHANILHKDSICFKIAAYYGHLNAIQFFLTSDKLEQHVDIHIDDDYVFNIAAERGYIDLVKYLLTSPELKEHSNPYSDNHYGLRFACSHNHQEIIKFLCSIPNIYRPDFLAGRQQGFHDACENDNLELVKLLLSLAKEVGQNIDVAAHDNRAWKTAVNRKSIDVLEFLYSFSEVKNALYDFSNSGLDSLPQPFSNSQKYDIKTIEFLSSLPEIKRLLLQDQYMVHTFKTVCSNHNLSLVNYVLTQLDYTPEQDFVKKNKRIMNTEVKELILKKQMFVNLDKDTMHQNIQQKDKVMKI